MYSCTHKKCFKTHYNHNQETVCTLRIMYASLRSETCEGLLNKGLFHLASNIYFRYHYKCVSILIKLLMLTEKIAFLSPFKNVYKTLSSICSLDFKTLKTRNEETRRHKSRQQSVQSAALARSGRQPLRVVTRVTLTRCHVSREIDRFTTRYTRCYIWHNGLRGGRGEGELSK